MLRRMITTLSTFTMSASTPFSSLFVAPADLHHALSNASGVPRIVPLVAGRNSSVQSFESQHIPGSVFFNMDVIRDTTSQYPMMLPTPCQFAKYMSDLHITPDDVLVVYDPIEPGFYSSPRVAWTCQHFGHKAVHVLNTFPRYVEEGFPVVSGKAEPANTNASTALTYPEQPLSSDERVMSFEKLRDIITNPTPPHENIQIIDARPASRFAGAPDTQTATLPVGHIPHAINVPFSSLLGVDKTVLPPAELAELFAKAGVRKDVPAVLYCNTGVTAAGLDLALRVGGFGMRRWLYDGSWSEWTKRVDVDGGLVDGVIEGDGDNRNCV